MGIFDNDDEFSGSKSRNVFNFDWNKYGQSLNDSIAGSAGGDGAALPSALPDVGKATFRIDANNDSQPPLDALEIKPLTLPAVEPIKALVSPDPAATAKPLVKPLEPILDKTTSFLNRIAQPENDAASDTGTLGIKIRKESRVEPESAINLFNKMADPDRTASSEQGTLGLRIRDEAQFNPDEMAVTLNKTAQAESDRSAESGTLGVKIRHDAKVDPDALERMADTLNKNYHSGFEQTTGLIEPGYMLKKLKSDKSMQTLGKQLSGILNRTSDAQFGMANDRANAMMQLYNADFDASVINGYSAHERRVTEDMVSTALNRREEVSYDPKMAEMQILPYLDRFNSPHGYYNNAVHSGFSDARFSMDELSEQVREHMFNGSKLTYDQAEQTAEVMASLNDTEYGKATRHFMASVHIGALTTGQEAIQTIAMLLPTLPPAEIAIFHYQQMYLAHGNDTAGLAREVENMAVTGNRMGDWGYTQLADGKNRLAGLRTDDYNDLRYFTTDPAKMALLRPDRLTGDFFETFLPTMVSLYLPTKGAAIAELRQGATLLTQFTWIAKRAYNTASTEKLIKLQRNPELVDNDPAFKRYMRDSLVAHSDPARAREYFIQGAARKSGLQSAGLSAITYGASRLVRHSTSDGTESQLLQYLQQFMLHEGKNMGYEAINAVNQKDFKTADEMEGDEERL